jgi:hypothetical protein
VTSPNSSVAVRNTDPLCLVPILYYCNVDYPLRNNNWLVTRRFVVSIISNEYRYQYFGPTSLTVCQRPIPGTIIFYRYTELHRTVLQTHGYIVHYTQYCKMREIQYRYYDTLRYRFHVPQMIPVLCTIPGSDWTILVPWYSVPTGTGCRYTGTGNPACSTGTCN